MKQGGRRSLLFWKKESQEWGGNIIILMNHLETNPAKGSWPYAEGTLKLKTSLAEEKRSRGEERLKNSQS